MTCFSRCVHTNIPEGQTFGVDHQGWPQFQNVVTKANQRLHCLRVFQKSCFSDRELLEIFTACLKSIVEYACQVWHPDLTQAQMHNIEGVQIRAMKIIRPDSTYWQALKYYDLTNLEERRISLCKSTYETIKEPDYVIHHLLPPHTRENTYNLRIHHQRRPCNRVKWSDGSFTNYAISMFEWLF